MAKNKEDVLYAYEKGQSQYLNHRKQRYPQLVFLKKFGAKQSHGIGGATTKSNPTDPSSALTELQN